MEKLMLILVNIVQFHLIGRRFDAGLEKENIVVAGHDRDRLELEPLG
jgi:hypothetical protein